MSFPVSKSKVALLHKSRSKKVIKTFKPQLTSLIDVMTILLIYLLKSFSAEGDIITLSKNLVLPESSARTPPSPTVVLTVNNTYLLAGNVNENVPLTTVDEILSSDSMIIPQLRDWLHQRREMTQKIAKYSSKTRFRGDITIQADKRIRFRLLKKIMYTCGQEEYNNFSLAVQRREE